MIERRLTCLSVLLSISSALVVFEQWSTSVQWMLSTLEDLE